MPQKLPHIIIDTDGGHDDALAMMLLVRTGLFDIRAITTVAGNSTLENVTRNAQAVMDLLEEQTIPIYSGSDKPLRRPLVKAVVHGNSGLDGLDMSQTKYSLTEDAVDQTIRLIKENPEQITILAIGPLTNIALCLKKDPSIAPLVKEIVIMGGAIEVAGNKNRVAEFNMFVDPEAADIVFRSEIKKVLVPLDPCNEIVLSLSTFEPLRDSSLYQPLKSMMKHFISGIESEEGVKGALVYDALAAYYLINPAAFTSTGMDIVIETKGEHTFGMTVAERRPNRANENMTVITKIDRAQFTHDLIEALRR
jgi:inosine-uridine nucleoside N-ribohydrolase